MAESSYTHEVFEVDDVMSKSPLLRDSGSESPNSEQYGTSLDPDEPELTQQTRIQRGAKKQNKDGNHMFLGFLTFFSAIGGFLFGYDTGVVSGAMLLIADTFHLSTVEQELIVSITIGFAAVFSLASGYLTDRFGRKPVILLASFVFTCGAVLLGVASNKSMLIVGRAILGIGIGFASMTVPVYIAESSPCHLRGRLVTLNNIFITGGQFIASLVDGAFSYDKVNGWRFMLGLAGVPSLIQFVGFWFMPESPRWLVSKAKQLEAREILQKIRNNPDVEEELTAIQNSVLEQQQIQEQNGGESVLIQMLRTPSIRRALIVGCGLQMFQQITGINTVMYYSATIIKMSGVKSASAAIWLASVTAFTNFIFTFVGLYLVEKIGRRALTIGSLAGTMVSLAVLAVGFQLAAFNSPHINIHPDFNTTHPACANYTMCNSCVTDVDCGFCYTNSSEAGYCVATYSDPDTGRTSSQWAAAGECAQQRNHTMELSSLLSLDSEGGGSGKVRATWAYDYCPTAYSWMATFGLILYLAFFAPGMGPMPWTVNSEIYPLWARSTGTALSTSTCWVFNLLISMTFLTLTETLTRYGAFWLYFGFALIGLIFVSICLPETKGKTLEEVEEVFSKPFCSKNAAS